MRLDRRIRIQLAVFSVITVTACSIMLFRYIKAPALLFGIGRYTVTLELPRGAGLYHNGVVSYRGTEVGRIESVRLTNNGVQAELSLRSGIDIPSSLRAEVHSQTAIGEQYVELLPHDDSGRPLKNGDVIPADHTSVPPDIAELLDATNRGLAAIPQTNLRTAIDESYTAVGGLGQALSRIVRGSAQLSLDAGRNLDPMLALIDRAQPVLDSQADTSDAIQTWAKHLANVTDQLRSSDAAVSGLLRDGPPSADQARQLLDRLQPTLPLLLSNLVSVAQVGITYQPALEQLLVLLPEAVAGLQGSIIADLTAKRPHKGLYLDFNLNFNLPPACNTGFLPPQQQRTANFEDYPDRAPGDLYCRVPQNSPFNVRGARNYPCLSVPGKRAPTVKMCESEDQYVPLNDGYNWKGDPNATLSGQDVPQLPPGTPPPRTGATAVMPPPISAAEYDPATGQYIGPDGHEYTQSDLSHPAPKDKKWQSMLIPQTGN